MEIVIPYKPRYPQTDIHKAFDSHRFCVEVAHRRMGKTVLAINQTVRKAVNNKLLQPQYAYVAPFLKQAKRIAWDYLKRYTAPFPERKVNESELFVEFYGRRIWILGADNPDAIRGVYLDGCVLDEYAQIKPDVWGEIVLPALSDRNGWALFMGTPKGQNQFYEMYQQAMHEMHSGNPHWWCGLHRADETGVLSQEQLDIMRSAMTDTQYRQEMLCDFSASGDDILITIDLVTDAASRKLSLDAIAGAPKVLGVDVARFGNDKSVIQRRQGLCAWKPKVMTGVDNMTLASILINEIQEFQPDAVFVDSGRGEGVIDRCRQLGYDVTEVNFGGRALKDNLYVNKRTEMWATMEEWLQAGGMIPNDPDLKTDLVMPTYCYDTANRMKLEPKDKIKERLGRSPDRADGLALTFAMPVVPKGKARLMADNNGLYFAQTKYDPYKRR